MSDCCQQESSSTGFKTYFLVLILQLDNFRILSLRFTDSNLVFYLYGKDKDNSVSVSLTYQPFLITDGTTGLTAWDVCTWLIDWLLVCSIYCSIYWLIDWSNHPSIDWLIDWLIDQTIHRLIDWLIDWSIDWLIDWLSSRQLWTEIGLYRQ